MVVIQFQLALEFLLVCPRFEGPCFGKVITQVRLIPTAFSTELGE